MLSQYLQIDLALEFFGNSSLSYFTPSSSEELESVSMAVKPSQTNSGIILSSGSYNQSQFTVLEVRNGTLQVRCNQETVELATRGLQSEEWHLM